MTGFKFQENRVHYLNCREAGASEQDPAFDDAEEGRFPWWLFFLAIIVGVPVASMGIALFVHWIAVQQLNSIDLSQAFIGEILG